MSRYPMILTARTAFAAWAPLAGPDAARHFVAAVRWNRWIALTIPVSIAAAVIAGTVGGQPAVGGVLSATIVWAVAAGGLSLWHRRAFRRLARGHLGVTDAERRDFTCRSPRVLADWISTHRLPPGA